jgi:hypothetical protein
MATNERDGSDADSNSPAGGADGAVETLHGGQPPRSDDLKLPRHGTEPKAEPSGGIETLHGGGRLPSDDELELPRHASDSEAAP